MYRGGREVEVLLAHPGGPLYANRDDGVWTIPKGLVADGEDLLDAAIREMAEETGVAARGPYLTLGSVKMKGGKIVHAWAFRGDCDPAAIRSNEFEMEWPPRSGRCRRFPEIDRAAWFTVPDAQRKILAVQAPFLDRLLTALEHTGIEETTEETS
jgi:predicted NUDIX family NTP pyrophosphohydrolase